MAQASEEIEIVFRQKALQYIDGLYGYALTLTRNRAEAEDLVQETYLRAARSASQLRPDSSLKSWMFTILRNIRLNQIRHTSSVSMVRESDGQNTDISSMEDKVAADPFSSLVTKSVQQDVRNAIDRLPSLHREVIMLREFEELSYAEIAQVVNCPVGTVMSRLGRAREKLKDLLRNWSDTPSRAYRAGHP